MASATAASGSASWVKVSATALAFGLVRVPLSSRAAMRGSRAPSCQASSAMFSADWVEQARAPASS